MLKHIFGNYFCPFLKPSKSLQKVMSLFLSLSLTLNFDKCCPFVPTNESDYKPNIENSGTIGRTGVGTPLKGSELSMWD